MDIQYDFGMIGLGVMGSNLLLNMADHGFAAIGYDLKPERGQALEAGANKGTVVKGVNEDFDDDLITLMEKMPEWEPAILDNKHVAKKIRQSFMVAK